METQITFDSILNHKLGAGKYHWISLLILCLVDLNDGVELLSMSLILPILKREWSISNFNLEVLSSIFYLGMMFGALITGKIADKYGRKPTILYASIIQFIVCLSFSTVNSLFFLIVLRFLYGFVFGFSLPLTISMVSEIFPLKFRGKCIILTNFHTSIGKVYAIILAYFILTDFNTGNWRLLMIICSISSLIVILGMVLYVKESPRFLISIEKFDEAFEIIDHIGRINKGVQEYIPLTEKEKQGLKNFQKKTFKSDEQASVKMLFSKKCWGVTYRLWIIWFSLIFFEFGSLVVLPFIFADQKKGFESILLAIAGELPSLILAIYLIDLKNLGRKNSLTMSCFILGFLNFVAYFLGDSAFFSVVLSIQRFFMKNSFSMLIPLTSELYNTNYRTVGYGYATSVGRFAATICPYLLFSMFFWDVYSCFLIFAVLCLLSTVAGGTLKFETAGKDLDSFLVEKEMVLYSPC